MAIVHATTTRALQGHVHGRTTGTTFTIPPGKRISWDPAKYVHTSQPVMGGTPWGLTVWVKIADLRRSVDIDAAEARRQHLGRSRTRLLGRSASRVARRSGRR